VYRHFANKEALFAAVCARGFEAFGAYLVRSLSGATPRERMVLAARMYLAFAVEHPRDYRVIFMGDAAAFGDEKVQGPTASPTFQFLVDRVAECVAAKVIARRDDVQTAMTIWALVHGLASLRITGHLANVGEDDHFSALFDRAVERLLAGMAPRATK
jgi:AcrR family transcriptional regulator